MRPVGATERRASTKYYGRASVNEQMGTRRRARERHFDD